MANNPGSYLEKILQDPSTYDKTSSNAALVYGVVPVLMLIITAFVGARAIKTIPEAWRQIKNPPSRPNMGPQMWVGEGFCIFAGLLALAANISFMVAARQNLGKHLSGMGLTEPVAAFARSVIAANNATNRNTDLMAYIDANSDKLDPVVVNALREFVSKFKVVMLDLYWCSGLYTLSITSQKISYNCCLMSMFAWNNQRLRKYLMGHSILSVVAFGATLFVGFMGTQPVHASWDIAVTRQREWSAGAIYIDTAIANLVLDALVLPIPYYFIWKLQMSRAGKWALNGLFGLQLVAFFIGVARTKMLGGLFGEDITYNAVPPLILTMSQLTVYIVCLCAPTLRWLWPPFKASIKKLCRNSPNVAPPVTLENVNYRAGHDSMRSNPYSQFDDCFIDDLPGNSAGVQSSVVSDIESTPSLNGPAALVENVV